MSTPGPDTPPRESETAPVADEAGATDSAATGAASQDKAETAVDSTNATAPATPAGSDAAQSDSTATATAATEESSAEQRGEKKILIGSQRDAADPSLARAKPKAVAEAQARPVRLAGAANTTSDVEAPIAMPEVGSMAGLGSDEDLEAEIEAALGNASLEDIVAGEQGPAVTVGAKLKARVTEVHRENVLLQLPGHLVGVASLKHFKEPPAPGEELEVTVNSMSEDEGTCDVSVAGAAVDVADWSDLEEGAVVEARVSGSNTGGLEVVVNSLKGFIPASQIDVVRVENFGDFANQKFQCVVMEVKPQKKRLVLSRRALLERDKQAKRQELIEALEAGTTHEGTVVKVMDFGAFIDIGGLEGLCHVSKLSWDRVTHPKDVVEVGNKVKVKVESIDRASGKLSLSIRDTMQDPWSDAEKNFPVNALVNGTVSRIAQFGAFVKLAPGVEGLVHISELAHHRVFAVKNIVKEGDQIEVKVLSFDRDAQKIGLSLKATQAKPEKPQAEQAEVEADEPQREMAVKNRTAPLKGGRDKGAGGEKFGLNW